MAAAVCNQTVCVVSFRFGLSDVAHSLNSGNINGFNINVPHEHLRIGIAGNNENDCNSCDTWIGFGRSTSPTVDDGSSSAFGYILIRASTPATCTTACSNGGTCIGVNVCACAAGWIGPLCTTQANSSCQDILAASPLSTSGVYSIGLGGSLVNVWCEMVDGQGFVCECVASVLLELQL